MIKGVDLVRDEGFGRSYLQWREREGWVEEIINLTTLYDNRKLNDGQSWSDFRIFKVLYPVSHVQKYVCQVA